jgi:hypothetical protein
LGFYNYRGEVTNTHNIDHGDEDSSNFADDAKDVKKKEKQSCGFDGRLITFQTSQARQDRSN